MMHMSHEVQSMTCVELTREFGAAVAVKKHVPLMRMRQAHGEGRQEDPRRHDPGNRGVMGHPLHPIKHTRGCRGHHVENLCDRSSRKGIKLHLTRSEFDNAFAPFPESLESDGAFRPQRLDAELASRSGLSVSDEGCRNGARRSKRQECPAFCFARYLRPQHTMQCIIFFQDILPKNSNHSTAN